MYIGGPFTRLKMEHSSAGSISLELKSGENTELDRGGWRIVDDENNRTSAGSDIFIYENKTPYIQCTVAADGKVEDYFQTLIPALKDELAVCTLTHISGDTYIGNGAVVGDIKPNRNAATIQIKIVFDKELERL